MSFFSLTAEPLTKIQIHREWSTVNTRGKMVAMIFSMQGVGQIVAPLVTMAVLAAFKGAIEDNTDNLDYVWRICIGLGAVPAIATVYSRFTLPESPQYSAKVQKDADAAQAALNSYSSSKPEPDVEQGPPAVESIPMNNLSPLEEQCAVTNLQTASRSPGEEASSGESISSARTVTAKTENVPQQKVSQKQIRHENIRDFREVRRHSILSNKSLVICN